MLLLLLLLATRAIGGDNIKLQSPRKKDKQTKPQEKIHSPARSPSTQVLGLSGRGSDSFGWHSLWVGAG